MKENNYVIFLDLNMSAMNGWQFMDYLEIMADSSNCMVFILTSSRNKLDIEKLMESPLIVDLLIKPINEVIFGRLKKTTVSKFGEY